MLLEEFQAVVATAETDGVYAPLASGTLKATDKIVQSSIRTLYGMKDAICANDAICCDVETWFSIWYRFLHVAPMVTGLICAKRDDKERMSKMLDTKYKQQTVASLEKQIGEEVLQEEVEKMPNEEACEHLKKMFKDFAGGNKKKDLCIAILKTWKIIKHEEA
eukprot:7953705-Karenia_brevis.AAC.1